MTVRVLTGTPTQDKPHLDRGAGALSQDTVFDTTEERQALHVRAKGVGETNTNSIPNTDAYDTENPLNISQAEIQESKDFSVFTIHRGTHSTQHRGTHSTQTGETMSIRKYRGRSSEEASGGEANLRLHMVTWNVATAEPRCDVTSLLLLDAQPATDLYVIGLQEVNSSPLRFLSDLLLEDPWSHLLMNTLAPKGYSKVSSVRMQGLLLLVFSKQDHLPFIRDIQTTYTRTGMFGYWGNKGGVSVRFSLYGHMMCFVNCHLAAHMDYALQRVDEFEYILEYQDFGLVNTPTVRDHKVVFWFGDLNFRISDHGMHFLRSSINSGRFNLLWERDQLLTMRKKEPFLQEFEEGPLKFKPTYKFNLNSDTYDTSNKKTLLGFNGKKRKPAWTDRILDHKPVIGIFNLEMRKHCESPLVRVWPEGLWEAGQAAVLSYIILEDFLSSTWDWIGLYKEGFKSASDYATFVWVKDELPEVNDVMQVSVNQKDVPSLGGEYVLGYFSYNMQSIVGLSKNFQATILILFVHQDRHHSLIFVLRP
ncbi:hypothetical protein UPYG_G00130100 [Umbra pygmaea]|uniref:Inositol polyphosphate-related phosphatase domain-containing protein n=1 Tax=Umbra pygmaea TaxID=75934 RepID=A0ABD0XA39_UMBPY